MARITARHLIVIVIGVLLALVSIFADVIGIGREPGFGYKQGGGLVVGIALVIIGVWWSRSAR